VLEDARITKLFFDCREDCNILQHRYDVKVQGKGSCLLELLLVDISLDISSVSS